MKQLLTLSILFFGLSLCAQNTRLIFSDSPTNYSKFDGEKISFLENKAKKYSDNEDIRIYEKFHENGQLAEVGLIINNKPDGVWKKYDDNGKLIAKTKYKDGKKRGKWIIWNYDGSVLAKGRYNTDGEKTGNWIYWSSVDHKYLEKSF
jgi:antitoxin component YwqK of YwqJK toxin-antitoxin module